MADVFTQFDTKNLLKNKHVLFLGDSNIRAQYKDLIWLLNFNTLIPHKSLKSKLEQSFVGDTLIERSKLHFGRDFVEKRLYLERSNNTKLEFIFLTRCYNKRLVKLFSEFKKNNRLVPDVIVINSCLWDLTRWGPNGVPEYKDNLVRLMRLMSESLPKRCLVIWCTALPTAPHVRGGLLIKQIEFIEPMLRFEVMEANTFARGVVVTYGFDVLDNHYHTRMQMHRRAKDGVHYLPIPVRFMTNLLLTHISLTWEKHLPNNIQSVLLDKAIAMGCKPTEEAKVQVPTGGIFSKINLVSPVVPKTRGLKVTFHTKEFGRQCNLFDNQPTEAPSTLCERVTTSSKVKSVVQLPQAIKEPQAGPYRNKRRRKMRRSNHPYQATSQISDSATFYNPYPNNTPSFYYNGDYYPYGNNYSDDLSE